jgi:hypothetical protein
MAGRGGCSAGEEEPGCAVEAAIPGANLWTSTSACTLKPRLVADLQLPAPDSCSRSSLPGSSLRIAASCGL